MSTSDNAPLLGKAVSSRRRRGAALAAVALALAGGLVFAVANRSDTTTSLITPDSIVVDGIPVGTPQWLTQKIVQNAMNDVIPIVMAPQQINVELQNVPGQPNSQRVVATIYMGKPWKTCGQAGFRTAQDCLDGVDLDYDAPPSLVASVNEAINNGKLKERLLYWADHFDADWADDLAPAAGPANNAMTQLNSGLHGKVGSIEKWLLIVIVVLGAVCLLCCVCCIIHVGTCGIL